MSQDETTLAEVIDLAWLRDFLAVLRDSGIASFAGFGFNITYPAEASTFSGLPGRSQAIPLGAVAAEYDHKTKELETNEWKNPNLWAHQNGKILKFDGSFE